MCIYGVFFVYMYVTVSHRSPPGTFGRENTSSIMPSCYTHQTPAAATAGPLGSTLQRVFCMPLAIVVCTTAWQYIVPGTAVNFAGCPRTWQAFKIGCKLLPRSRHTTAAVESRRPRHKIMGPGLRR